MKRTVSIILIVTLAGLLGADQTAAGWFDKKDQDQEKKLVPRYDNYPSMGFTRGRLGRDVRTGWTVGEYDIRFMADCEVLNEDGVAVDLQEGRKALIMGPRWGSTVIAWRVKILSSLENDANVDPNAKLQAGDSPYVAVGTAPQ